MLSASKHNQATPTHSRSDTASGSDKRAGGGARLRLSPIPRSRLPRTQGQITGVATVF